MVDELSQQWSYFYVVPIVSGPLKITEKLQKHISKKRIPELFASP